MEYMPRTIQVPTPLFFFLFVIINKFTHEIHVYITNTNLFYNHTVAARARDADGK